jgi:hypothetical protein
MRAERARRPGSSSLDSNTALDSISRQESNGSVNLKELEEELKTLLTKEGHGKLPFLCMHLRIDG